MVISPISGQSTTKTKTSGGISPIIDVKKPILEKKQPEPIQITPTQKKIDFKQIGSNVINTIKKTKPLVIKGLSFALSAPQKIGVNAGTNLVTKAKNIEVPKVKVPKVTIPKLPTVKEILSSAKENFIDYEKTKQRMGEGILTGFLGEFQNPINKTEKTYIPKNDAEKFGAWLNNLGTDITAMEGGGINKSIGEGISLITSTPKFQFVTNTITKFASKEFKAILNKLKPIKLTFEDAIAVNKGTATPDQLIRFKMAEESGIPMRDIFKNSEKMGVSPKTKIYDFIKKSIDDLTNLLKGSLSKEEQKLLGTGIKKDIATVIGKGEQTSQEIVAKVISEGLENTTEGKQIIKLATEAQQTGQNIVVDTAISKIEPLKPTTEAPSLTKTAKVDTQAGLYDTNLKITDAYGKNYLGYNMSHLEKVANEKGYNLYDALVKRVDGVADVKSKINGMEGIMNDLFPNRTIGESSKSLQKAIETTGVQKNVAQQPLSIKSTKESPQISAKTGESGGVVSQAQSIETPPVGEGIKKPIIENSKTIGDVRNSLKNIKTQIENLTVEAEGKSTLAQEQREGLNTENILKLKRIYNINKKFQEGDIETIRNSASGELLNKVIENVQEKYPYMSEQEAFDYAINLPNKSEEIFKKSPDIKSLIEKQKKLDEYMDLLKSRQKELALEKDAELDKEWRDVLSAQENLYKIIEVARGLLPVGEGKIKASRLETRVTDSLNNISQEQIDQLGLSAYNQMSKKENIASASEYVTNNPEEALKVLNGEIEAPKGILRNSIYVAMENLALDNVDLARRLASLQSTRLGQELSILTELNPDSPVTVMRDIIKIREEVFKKRYKGRNSQDVIKKEVEKIRKEIKIPDKVDWSKFLDEIECK